jgi:hypothetical protein
LGSAPLLRLAPNRAELRLVHSDGLPARRQERRGQGQSPRCRLTMGSGR